MQPVLTVLKGSDARRRYKPPARPYHLFYYTGFVNTFTENGRTFYPYPHLRGASFLWKEGVSTRAPSLGRGCRAQRGGVGFLFCDEAASSLPSPLGKALCREKRYSRIVSLPHWGRGTAPAVDRVLSQTAHLRRSFPFSFIPLEPYPARSARHLPHAGKALSVVILFPHMHVFALTMQEKRYSRFVAFPIGKGGPRSGARVLSYIVDLRCISSLFFMPLEPYPARSARHLPHAGKAVFRG